MNARAIVGATRRGGAVALCAAFAIACGSEPEREPATTQTPPPPCDGCVCPDGFELDARGIGCSPVLARDCPAGTRPSIGELSCVPVGWTACPEGFVADPSGWGCRPVLPAAPCGEAELEVLGSEACQPVACTADFPPADATAFVDDDFGPGEIDATHFATIAAALAAAPDGATIAIEAGQYLESLVVDRDVALVGRCAKVTSLESPTGTDAGILVNAGAVVVVRGMTITGHRGGLVTLGGEVTVEDCALEKNVGGAVVALDGASVRVARSALVDGVPDAGTLGVGALVQGASDVLLERCSVARNHVAGVISIEPMSRAALMETVVRGTLSGSPADNLVGYGVMIREGATVDVSDSALLDNVAANLSAVGGTAVVTHSVLRGAMADALDFGGHGVEIAAGGSVEITESALVGNAEAGVVLTGAGTTLVAGSVAVRGALAADEGQIGVGVAVDTGAFAELRDMAMVANREAALVVQQPGASVSVARTLIADTQRDENGSISGAGVRVGFGGALIGEDVAILRNRVSGIFVGGATIGVGGSAKLSRAIIADTMPDEAGTLGRGVDVWQASLEMDSSAVLGHRQAGIVVGGDSGSAVVRSTAVQGTTGQADATFGDGIAVVLGAEALLERCWVTDNARVGLFFAVGTCTAIDVVIAANAIGIHAQDGSQLQEVDAVGEGAGPLQVLVTTGSRFVDNEIRVGSGLLAVPSPIP